MSAGSAPEPTARPFLLGVNYWPARSAMGFWRSFDEDEVRQDFSRVKNQGLSLIRLFLIWEDFQPSHDVIDRAMLTRLEKTLDIASDVGLLIMPTLFTGHMSGANWLPEWAVRKTPSRGRFPTVCGGRVLAVQPIDWYTDTTIRAAQAQLATECATTLAGHPALFAWDLGNENSNCVVPRGPGSARAWLRSMVHAIRKMDPKTPVTIGLHMEDLQENRGLTPLHAAEVCDFLTMHGYPGYASFTAGPTDERLLPFLSELTRFLGKGMEVLFSEFGVPTLPREVNPTHSAASSADGTPTLVSEEEAASYFRRALRALQQSGASGALSWCYSDYFSTLFDGPPFDSAPHERSFGLFRADGSAKPAALELSAFSRQHPRIAKTPRVGAAKFIDLAIDDYYDSPDAHMTRLFRKYCAALGESSPFSE